jgi:hypothetical protein
MQRPDPGRKAHSEVWRPVTYNDAFRSPSMDLASDNPRSGHLRTDVPVSCLRVSSSGQQVVKQRWRRHHGRRFGRVFGSSRGSHSNRTAPPKRWPGSETAATVADPRSKPTGLVVVGVILHDGLAWCVCHACRLQWKDFQPRRFRAQLSKFTRASSLRISGLAECDLDLRNSAPTESMANIVIPGSSTSPGAAFKQSPGRLWCAEPGRQ